MSVLISSKYRDRVQYQNPCSFTMNASSQSLQDNRNRITKNYPLYNFSFCSNNKFPCTIVSIQDSYLFLDDSVFDLIGKTTLNTQKLSFPSVENSFHILKGFFVEIDIADTIFYREITAFDPIDKKVTIKSPFPFVMNQSSTISCFLTNRSTSLQITANGNFFQQNDFLYNRNDIVLYNIRTNEFRNVTSRKENVLSIESPFSSYQVNDQFLVFYTEILPKITSDFILQDNNKYFSSQYGRIKLLAEGKGYKNNQKVILKPVGETYDSNFSYHVYHLKKVLSSGVLDPIENLVLETIGADQILSINTQYEVFVPNGNTATSLCILKISTLHSVFCFEDTSNIDLENLEKKYFMPLVLTNQFVIKNNDLYTQPNNSILNYDHYKLQNRNITEFENINGVFEIQKAYLLANGKYAIKTRFINHDEKLTLMESLPDLSVYQGVQRFMVLGEIEDGETPLFTNNLIKANINYSIRLETVVVPNLKIKNLDLKVYELPYLLLNLKNKTQASNLNKNNIQSNNIEVSKNKFILSIDKDSIDENIDFLKLSCGSTCQEISFDPYDNMEIEISLPNGKVLEFEKEEHLLPIVPNDKIEIVILLQILES